MNSWEPQSLTASTPMKHLYSSLWSAARRLASTLYARTRASFAAKAAPPAPSANGQMWDGIDPAVKHVVSMLKTALDRHPRARKVFGHLALLEQGLLHLGIDMLRHMSAGTLRRARLQLASVASEEESRPLIELIDLAYQEAYQEACQQQCAEALRPLADFSPSRFAEDASEGDPLAYFELMRAWQDTLVEETEQAPAAGATPMPEEPVWQPTMPMTLLSVD